MAIFELTQQSRVAGVLEAEMSGIFGKLKNLLSSSWDDMIMTLVVIALALLTARLVFGGVIRQTSFASPKGGGAGSHRMRKNMDTKTPLKFSPPLPRLFVTTDDPVSDFKGK